MIVAIRLLSNWSSSGRENDKSREKEKEKESDIAKDFIINKDRDNEMSVFNKERNGLEVGITESSRDKSWTSDQAKKMLTLLEGLRTIFLSIFPSSHLYFYMFPSGNLSHCFYFISLSLPPLAQCRFHLSPSITIFTYLSYYLFLCSSVFISLPFSFSFCIRESRSSANSFSFFLFMY